VLEKRDSLLVITLNRPQKANALSIEMTRSLADTLQSVRADTGICGVLMTGAGERVFSGGVDVRETSALPTEEFRRARSSAFFAVLSALVNFEKPAVAAVNGAASGGGFMIAALADMRIASNTASFALPEIDLGTPPLAGLAILQPLIGGALAYDLVQSARKLDAVEAVRCGLVRALVPQGEVLPEAEKLVRELMNKNPRAFAASKAWLRKPMRAALEQAEQAMVAWRAAGSA